jgi:hypothetical protein
MPYERVLVNIRMLTRWQPTKSDCCKKCGKQFKIKDVAWKKNRGACHGTKAHYCENCADLLHIS